MAQNIIILFHNLIIFLFVIAYFGIAPSWSWLQAIPGLLILAFTTAGIGLILAVLSARFRDVPNLVTNIIQVAFFVTPIIWEPSLLPERTFFLDLNPFYYLLEAVRTPLLGEWLPLRFWLINLALLIATWAVAFVFFGKMRRRIAYWI